MTLRTTRQYAEVLVQGAGKVRVTRQVAEVLATGSGKARVSRQYVEYLISNASPPSNVHNVAAADALTFTDTARLTPIPCKIQDALNLADNNLCNGTKRNRAIDSLNVQDASVGSRTRPKLCSAADSLSLGQLVNINLCQVTFIELALADQALVEKTKHVVDTLAIADASSRNIVLACRRTDALGLTDLAVGFVRATIHNVTAQSQLMLADQAAITAHVVHKPLVSCLDILTTLQDQATCIGPVYASASDLLSQTRYSYDPAAGATAYVVGLQDAASAALVPGQPRTAGQLLSFGEQAVGVVIRAAAIPAAASDTLVFTSAAARNQVPAAASALLFADAASAVAVKALRDALTLGDMAQVTGVRNVSASSLLSLEEAVAFIVVRRDWEWRYHPFIGAPSSGSPPATLVWSPVAGVAAGTLVYPAAPPYTDWLTLRSPDLGNKDRLQFNRVSRETRGGTLIVFADPLWPKVQAQVLTFSGLNETEARGLLDFMTTHLGLEIGYVDWEQRYWTGVITNTTEPMTQDGRGMYTASFEFEGELAT
jgi:hypothetical protein